MTDIPWDFKQDVKLHKIKELKGDENFIKPKSKIMKSLEDERILMGDKYLRNEKLELK